MRRRDFIKVVAGTGAAWPFATRAQPAMPVIGFLDAASAADRTDVMRAFREGLAEAGYIEGQNVTIEYRWAEGRYDRLPGLAADPIAAGLVASLSRPAGNVTGVTSLNLEVGPKRLEFLHELVPTATTMAALVNPTNPSNAEILSRDLQATARVLGLQLHLLHASSDADIDAVFATLTELRAGGLVIGTDAFFQSRDEKLAALTLRYRIPTIYQWREFVAAGGLISYGGSAPDSYRLAGVYTGRILKGEKPADLPVQQATKLELFINLKTAKALGLTVPQSLLASADEVIE